MLSDLFFCCGVRVRKRNDVLPVVDRGKRNLHIVIDRSNDTNLWPHASNDLSVVVLGENVASIVLARHLLDPHIAHTYAFLEVCSLQLKVSDASWSKLRSVYPYG